jgi:DUF4097 and DUF4098 domain-containing protein YvlB
MKLISSFIIIGALLGMSTTTFAAADGTHDAVSEKTVAADPAATVMLCLESGNIVVRGWERKEVRARNTSGGQIDLRRADASSDTALATRLEVLMSESPDERPRPGECGQSGDIVLDVPQGSTVQLRGRSGDIHVTGIAALGAETQSGNIDLRSISSLVEVTTANGDIAFKHSTGRARLRTISGQIDIGDAGPREQSDDLRANTTSGDITLDNVRYARVVAATSSGNVIMRGPLARGGYYDLKTSNGDVTLTLPADSSFYINATVYHGGEIVTDFPVRLTSSAKGCQGCVEPGSAKPPKEDDKIILMGGNLKGVYGASEKGDATLTLASFSGSVRLRKAVTSNK